MAADRRVLRVCADPNNLPFSNQRQEGFENRLAEVIARNLNASIEYTWWSQRKSFIKNSLADGRCDMVMGIPAALDAITPTQPYYRSTYVFVSRQERHLQIESLADPRLHQWRIGIHVVGEDYAPPAIALARQGLSANIRGYSLFGAYGEENPPAQLVHAVAAGDVDLAIVWGPFAGYFAQKERAPLDISPVSPPMFMGVPFTYDVSIGVRKGDDALRAELDRALEKDCAAVQSILREYGLPRAPDAEGGHGCESSRQSPAPFSR
jgi:quinoprotein dehydrogenase-associated probable ABC transporter substrate-binding protein